MISNVTCSFITPCCKTRGLRSLCLLGALLFLIACQEDTPDQIAVAPESRGAAKAPSVTRAPGPPPSSNFEPVRATEWEAEIMAFRELPEKPLARVERALKTLPEELAKDLWARFESEDLRANPNALCAEMAQHQTAEGRGFAALVFEPVAGVPWPGLRDPDPSVRAKAVVARASRWLVDGFVADLANEPAPEVQRALLAGLSLAPEHPLNGLLPLLQSLTPEALPVAVSLVAERKIAGAAPLLLPLFEREGTALRVLVAEALARLGERDAPILEGLIAALSDHEIPVRAAVHKALRHLSGADLPFPVEGVLTERTRAQTAWRVWLKAEPAEELLGGPSEDEELLNPDR